MKRTPVNSSNIHSVGHDGDVMHVRFKNGGLYKSGEPISVDLHKQFMAAESKGRFFHKHLRGLKWERIDDDEPPPEPEAA